MNLLLLAASGISIAICLLHVTLGGREAVRPLLQAPSLESIPRFTNYYCWHLVTLVIGSLAVAFGLGAIGRASADLVAAAVVVSGLFSVWSVVMVVWHQLRPLDFPQWALFASLAVLGAFGLWS
ncbi:MAG: hypothetical protein ACRCUE_04190 [Bosea sp. (in: a-proteobacteria)]